MYDEEISASLFSTIQDAQVKYYEKIRHPFVAGLELTPQCNLRCVHCYISDKTSIDYLSADEWKIIIDKLYEHGVFILYMTGGEILTRKDFLEIYVYAKKKGFIIELLTNITCLTEEHIKTLQKYPPSVISISIYGMSNDTYLKVTGKENGYLKLKKNVETLVNNDINVELKFIGIKNNIQDFEKAERWAKKLGVEFKYNFEIFPTLDGQSYVLDYRLDNEEIIEFEKKRPEVINIYSEVLKKKNPFKACDSVPVFTCNVASTLMYIDSMGFVSPCNKMRLMEHNILKENIGSIWDDYIEKYAKMLAPEDYKCKKCDFINLCAPCPVVNKLSTGSYTIPDSATCSLNQIRGVTFKDIK